MLDNGKETLGVTVLDAEPDAIIVMPGDSLLPFTLAACMAVVFGAMLANNWLLLGFAALLLVVILLIWLAPASPSAQERHAAHG